MSGQSTELPELTEADMNALCELDLSPIFGTTEERLRHTVGVTVRLLRDRVRYRDLLERAIRGLKCIGEFHYPDTGGVDPHTLDCSLAGRVSQVFCTGMTRATELCREFGQDPDFNEGAERRREDDDESER